MPILEAEGLVKTFGSRRVVDGVGFAGNPRLGLRQPDIEEASALAGSRRTSITVVMNYLRGLRMRPLATD